MNGLEKVANSRGGGQAVAGVAESAASDAAEMPSKTDDVRQAAVQGVRWFSLSTGVVQVVGVGSAVLLARLIAPAEFGRLAVAIVVNEFALMIANETIGTPLVQRERVEREHLEAATFAALVLGFVLAALTFFLLPLLTTPLFGSRTTSLFRLFAAEFVIAGFLIVPLALLQRRLDFRRISIGELIATPVSAGVAIVLAVAGLGAKAYVIGMLAGMVTMTLVYATGAPLVRPRWRYRALRDLMTFGAPALGAGIAGTWYRNIDYVIMGARLSPASVGFYYRAFTLGVEYERRLSGIVARVAFPVYARTDDPAERLALRLRIVRLNAAVVYPFLAVFIAVAPVLVPWLFGTRWAPAVLPAQILTAAGMASCIRNLTAPTVLAAGRPTAQLAFSAVEAVLYAAVVWLASSHGLVAVCLAVSGFQLLSLVTAYTVLLRAAVGVPRTQIFRDLGSAVAASAGVAALGALVTHALGHRLPAAWLCLIVGFVTAPVYLMALRSLSAQSWNDLLMIARRLLPSRARAAVPSLAAPLE